MKAPAFAYRAVASLTEAIAALAEHGDAAKVLAGGQSLLPALNLRLLAPEILIDIGRVPELCGLAVAGGRLRIGALTRHAEIERSGLVRAHAPLLADAVRHVAHPAIRSRGTFGGSLAHADPAAELPACAVALRATIVVAGPEGERRIPANAFFLGIYETALRPEEILVAVDVPVAEPGQRHAFLELSRRSGDYALVGLAAVAAVSDGVLTRLDPVFFAAGPRPLRAERAVAHLVGRAPDEAALAAACAALAGDLEPEADLQVGADTRLHLARVLLRRGVARLLAGGAEGRAAA